MGVQAEAFHVELADRAEQAAGRDAVGDDADRPDSSALDNARQHLI